MDDQDLEQLIREEGWWDHLRANAITKVIIEMAVPGDAADLEELCFDMLALKAERIDYLSQRYDQNRMLAELTRLRMHLALVAQTRDRLPQQGLRWHLLDGHLHELDGAMISRGMAITRPLPGLPGGWEWRSEHGLAPLHSQLPAGLTPPPDTHEGFPLWRSEHAASAALADFRARPEANWDKRDLAVRWTCVKLKGRLQDQIVDEQFWASL